MHNAWTEIGYNLDIQLTLHSRPIIFLETSWTLAEARATAVSARTSTTGFVKPPSLERLMKLSSTMSISSGTCRQIRRFRLVKIFRGLDVSKWTSFNLSRPYAECQAFSQVEIAKIASRKRLGSKLAMMMVLPAKKTTLIGINT